MVKSMQYINQIFQASTQHMNVKQSCFTATGMQADAVMPMQGGAAYLDSVLNGAGHTMQLVG